MANIGKASLLIVPKFDGLTKSINTALSKANSSVATSQGVSGGSTYGKAFGSGILKQSAIFGAISTVTSKAIEGITSHLGSAIGRLDTMKNYPTVMQALGYSADDAEASIKTMSDRLSSLPTTLDSMVGTVQGLSAITGDLDKSTKLGLALNDMMLSGGKSTQVVNSAMEQFQQILSKGKPELQDWRSLVQAAPGQMDQLAKSMLGPTANANDLYAAMGGGKNEAIFTMDELMDAIIRLDEQGGGGFSSFREQAETASGGIQTAMDNMGNAFTKGLANIMDNIGRENIVGAIDSIKSGINGAFEVANDIVSKFKPMASEIASIVAPIADAFGRDLKVAIEGIADVVSGFDVGAIVNISGAFLAFNAVSPIIGKVAGALPAVSEGLFNAGVAAAKLGLPKVADGFLNVAISASDAASVLAGPVGIAVAAVAAGAGILVAKVLDAKRKSDNFKDAISGVSDAASRASALVDYSGTVDAVGQSASDSAKSVDELVEAMQKHADNATSLLGNAETEVATLQTARDIINEYAGQTDLSTEAQGKLEWAISTVNDALDTSITAQDVMNGKYTDADGNVQDLTSSINDLIDAKQREAKTAALTDILTEAYKNQYEAQKTLDGLQDEYNAKIEASAANYEKQGHSRQEALELAKTEVETCTEVGQQYKQTREAIEGYNEEIDSTTTALGELMVNTGSVKSVLEAMGEGVTSGISDIDGFSQALYDAGISTETLNAIGSENMAELADIFTGNTDAMVWAIQNLNNTPVVDKDGTVTVNDAQLIDAQGRIYTWNGEKFVDQDGNVAVNDQELVDAQGRVYTWNGSELKYLSGEGRITGNLPEANAQKDRWNSTGLRNFMAEAVATITIRENSKAAKAAKANGVRTGGQIKRHASGFFSNAPTMIDAYNMIGEAGTEYYDGQNVIPVGNTAYSSPFEDRIAAKTADAVKGADAANAVYALMGWLQDNLGAVIEQSAPAATPREFARMVRSAS